MKLGFIKKEIKNSISGLAVKEGDDSKLPWGRLPPAHRGDAPSGWARPGRCHGGCLWGLAPSFLQLSQAPTTEKSAEVRFGKSGLRDATDTITCKGWGVWASPSSHLLIPQMLSMRTGFPGGASGKGPICQRRGRGSHTLDPWLGRPPGMGGPPAPVFLPGGSQGQRRPAGCSPCGCKESNTAQRLNQQRQRNGGLEDFQEFEHGQWTGKCWKAGIRSGPGNVYLKIPAHNTTSGQPHAAGQPAPCTSQRRRHGGRALDRGKAGTANECPRGTPRHGGPTRRQDTGQQSGCTSSPATERSSASAQPGSLVLPRD